MKYFYGVTIANEGVQSAFDLLAIVAEPQLVSRRPAHITLKGPCSEKDRLDNYWLGETVGKASIETVGMFLGKHQQTVYFDFFIEEYKNHWWKRDFPNGKVHLTIYDGSNPIWAKRILESLLKFNWCKLPIKLSPIIELPNRQPPEKYFKNIELIKALYKTACATEWPGTMNISHLSEHKRIDMIERIAKTTFKMSGVSAADQRYNSLRYVKHNEEKEAKNDKTQLSLL